MNGTTHSVCVRSILNSTMGSHFKSINYTCVYSVYGGTDRQTRLTLVKNGDEAANESVAINLKAINLLWHFCATLSYSFGHSQVIYGKIKTEKRCQHM